jgi:hypothetical protein
VLLKDGTVQQIIAESGDEDGHADRKALSSHIDSGFRSADTGTLANR